MVITEIKGTAGWVGWKVKSTLPWVLETAGDTLMTVMDLMKKENIKSLVNRQGKKMLQSFLCCFTFFFSTKK